MKQSFAKGVQGRQVARTTGRNLILGLLALVLGMLLHATEAAAQPAVPSGWQLDQAASSPGVSVYRNGSAATYMTVIALSGSQAATVTPVASPDGSYYGEYPRFTLKTAQTHHQELRNANVGRDVYSVNLAFFDPNTRSLPFAHKVNWSIQTKGHNSTWDYKPSEFSRGQQHPGRGIFFGSDGQCTVLSAGDPNWLNMVNSSRHFVAGLDPLEKMGSLRPRDFTGRTYLGGLDLNADGRMEWLLILSCGAASVDGANSHMNGWGVPNFARVQVDGGGSSSLWAKGDSKINSTRSVPSVLSIVAAPPAPQYSNDCNAAPFLNCGQSVRHSSEGYPANIQSYGCSSWQEPGRERLYRLAFQAGRTYTITVTPRSPSGFDPDIFLLTSCQPASCVAFNNTTITYTAATTGTFYLMVDAYRGPASGEYDLSMQCSDPPSSPCETSVTTLNCGSTYTNLHTFGYPRNTNSYPVSTWQQPGAERLCRIWMAAAGQRVTVTVTSRSSGYDPDLFATRPGCSPQEAYAFADVRLQLTAAQPGWTYFWIDGYGPNRPLEGYFDLSVSACTYGREAEAPDETDLAPFQVFPNPAAGFATIQWAAEKRASDDGTLEVELRDLQGRTVLRERVDAANGSHRLNLALPAGVYLLGVDRQNWQRLIVID